jgi:hypothetical protein
MEETKDDTSMKDLMKKLVDLNEQLVETKQVKGWKLPRRARVNKIQAKRNYATFLIIKDNSVVSFIKAPIQDDGTVDIEGFPRIATVNHRLIYNNKPFYIMPSWSMGPFSAIENYGAVERDKLNIAGRRLVLARLQREQIKPTKKRGGLY